MPRYTGQYEVSFGVNQNERAIVPDSTASVAVEYWTGTAWAADENSPITKPTTLFTRGLRVRLTPTGGGFFIEEGEGL
jgi:hypothetical protein